MKRDGKYFLILLAAYFAAVLLFPLVLRRPETGHLKKHKTAQSLRCENLQIWYQGFNEEYFNNKLPQDALVQYGNPGKSNLAITFKVNGQFHIILSAEFNPVARTAHATLLHEMCHEAVWNQEFDDHGPKFQACMMQLAEQGAFKEIW